MTLQLDMCIGPVQGFVAQSRRTRDLWSSSYLLSFLSAHAMRGISQAGGSIVRPSVANDPLFAWVCAEHQGSTGPGEPPRIGSVPNHFVAELAPGSDPAAVARAGMDALDAAWRRVHRAVWQRFVEASSAQGKDTAVIWDRQTAAFWEVLWTVGEASTIGRLHSRRKHWRSQWLADEHGDKCTLMPDFQELSGVVSAQGPTPRTQQDAFWGGLRRDRDIGPRELRPDERLCAIALVKRLFPKVARSAVGWPLDVSRWPSTAGMAAVPWLRRLGQAAPPQAEAFAAELRAAVPLNELNVSPSAIPALANMGGPLLGLDANYLQRSFLHDERLCPLKPDATPEQRARLIKLLEDLQCARDDQGVRFGCAPVFYALLLADGDRLSQLVGSLGGSAVGSALAAFTARAAGIVEQHSGVTIYAGGDDVLAMLPVPDALACAAALAEAYASGFRFLPATVSATLSAAVVFAHVRVPLSAVLSEAHRLLDDVAKDQNGRNSLAVAVLKRGGLNLLWSTTWQRTGGQSSVVQLNALAAVLRQRLSQPGVSSSLLYRLRDTLSLLCDWPQWAPGAWGVLPAGFDLGRFLRAEVISSLEDQGIKEAEVDKFSQELTNQVLPLLTPARASISDQITPATPREVGVDALLLARFLAAPPQEDDS